VTRARILLAAGAALALAGCQTAPIVPVIEIADDAAPGEAPPVDVAVPVSDNPAEGLSENDWGGEVPQAKPTEEIDDGGLGDIK